MRPQIIKIGTCTTAVPSMKGVNPNPAGAPGSTLDFCELSQLTHRSVQLVNADGNWTAGSLEFQASLDGGVTWGAFLTAGSAGLFALPEWVLGRFRVVASGLPASTQIDVWLSGRDTRTDF